MKVPVSWLNEYVELTLPIEELELLARQHLAFSPVAGLPGRLRQG